MGSQVTLFFTFWGLSLLKKESHIAPVKKSLTEKMMSAMLSKGSKGTKLSKMNMLGMGTLMMKHKMKKKNVNSLAELIAMASQNGIRMVACSMTMEVMGIKESELIDGVEIAGVANYLAEAEQSNTNLFI
jgi:peroxiredoxin family protein